MIKKLRNRIQLSKKTREDGFSLLEVLLTTMIMAVALVALLSIFIYGFHLLMKMNQVALAIQCVQEETELIRTKTYDEILSLGSSFTHDNLSLLDNGTGILALESSEGDDIKKLTVSVTWDFKGNQMRKDIATFITREGVNRK